ncbi:MAG: TM2 domain-containing protein [Clostridia bacterium]|nr:TM2 domain-containing protein [Clostridia bacterium]
MRCPCCGAKLRKNDNMCIRCGTKLSQIENASHQAVTKARKEFTPEKVVLTKIWPKDLSYKNTLLMCIFLGTFGGHYFYVKRKIPGIIYLVCWSIFLVFSFIASQYTVGDSPVPQFNSPAMDILFGFACCAGALITVLWLMDIIRISFKRFYVPVVLENNNKNKGKK